MNAIQKREYSRILIGLFSNTVKLQQLVLAMRCELEEDQRPAPPAEDRIRDLTAGIEYRIATLRLLEAMNAGHRES